MDQASMVGNVLVSSLTNKRGKINTLFGGGNEKLVVPMSLYSSSTSFQLPEHNTDDSDDDSDDENNQEDGDGNGETSNQVIDDDIYDSLLGLMEENKLLENSHESVTPSNVSMLVEEIEESPAWSATTNAKTHVVRDKSLKNHSIPNRVSSKKHTKKHKQHDKKQHKQHKQHDKKQRKLTKKNNNKKKRKSTHKN